MKIIKFSKSEHILLINLASIIFSFSYEIFRDKIVFNQYDNSFEFIYFIAFFSIIFSLFCHFGKEITDNRRWLTKKEKIMFYIFYLIFFVFAFIYEVVIQGKADYFLPIFSAVVVFIQWIIAFAVSPFHDKSESDYFKTLPAPSDAFVYENENQVKEVFRLDVLWYGKAKYKRLLKVYIKTAKEFSGKKTVYEIENIVQGRMLYANLRPASIATSISMVLIIIIFGICPFYDPIWHLTPYMAICQLYGIFSTIGNINTRLTPNE